MENGLLECRNIGILEGEKQALLKIGVRKCRRMRYTSRSKMSPFKQCFTLLLLLDCFCAGAQTFSIRDGGMNRTFVVEEVPAVGAQEAPVVEPELVLYEQGVKKTEYTKRTVTRQILVELKPGTDPAALAAKHGAVYVKSPSYAPGFHILETSTAFGALTLSETLRQDPAVLSADPLLERKMQKKSIPNDPQFTNQWHLLNTGQNGGTAGIDIHVTNVWETYQGSNLVIGIVDDGLLTTHEDLEDNVDTTLDWDFNGNDADPSPGSSNDDHGTPCAGVAAGRGNNGKGISGAAPQATLVGFRLIAAATTDQQEADALSTNNALIQIKSNSWGPDDKNPVIEGPGKLTAGALKTGAETGRSGKGNLFFWAGGNGLEYGDNANYDGYANSIYTIAIGAVGENGTQAYYSEPGACLVACAPGGDGIGLTTTTSTGGYKSTFSGTSAATPLAAGVGALMLEANTNLGWRDVQEILMQSARKIDASDSDWTNNAAGFHFNHKYGAGMIDAEAAVELAENWRNLGAHTNVSSSKTNLNQAIPDDYGGVASQTFTIAEEFRVEHVTLETEITHTYRSDIEIWLISPAGTENLLAWRNDDAGTDLNWTFSTVRNWGENSSGDWTVEVYDNFAEDTGTVNRLTLTLYGTHDADSDLMDDTWEAENFGSITNADLTSDHDQDGFSDYSEWRAGTQPTNAASGLFIETFEPTGGQLGWQSVSGKTYTIEYTTNLLENFQTLETGIAATPPENSFTNLPAGPRGFCRILLETN